MKSVLVFVLIVVIVSNSRAQTSASGIASDSVILAREDSLEVVEMFLRQKPHGLFLQRKTVAGVTGGMPGGINLIVGGYYDRFGIRAEGGAFPMIFFTISGLQGNLSYVLYRDEHSLIELSALCFQTFTSSADGPPGGEEMHGFGAGMAFNGGGFFFEISAGHTTATYGYSRTQTSPRYPLFNAFPMTVQIGYVH
jgi:hypothetical protein